MSRSRVRFGLAAVVIAGCCAAGGCSAGWQGETAYGAGTGAGDPIGIMMMESLTGQRVAVGSHSGGTLLAVAAGDPAPMSTAGVVTDD